MGGGGDGLVIHKHSAGDPFLQAAVRSGSGTDTCLDECMYTQGTDS